MYEEIPYRFKYMLNKIINCIIEYIVKNMSNHKLIETKLLLINNYILDIFRTSEISRNDFMNKKFQKMTNSATFSEKTVSPEYDKNVSLSKFTNIFLNIIKKDKDDSFENYIKKISPYKDKNKIIKLKKLLKNEQEKSMIKELSYLKRLSFVQEKLNFYESKKNNIEKPKNKIEKDFKSNSSVNFKEDKKFKSKLNNKVFNAINNLSYLTVINSCKNKKINFFQNNFIPNTSRIVKHSVSHGKINDKNKKQIIKNYSSLNYSNREEKLIELIKDKKNFIK